MSVRLSQSGAGSTMPCVTEGLASLSCFRLPCHRARESCIPRPPEAQPISAAQGADRHPEFASLRLHVDGRLDSSPILCTGAYNQDSPIPALLALQPSRSEGFDVAPPMVAGKAFFRIPCSPQGWLDTDPCGQAGQSGIDCCKKCVESRHS